MDLGLKGKVAVITGGSVGIGLAIAEGLAAEGVDIVIAARNVERVRGEADRIAKSFGVKAEGVAAMSPHARGRTTLSRTSSGCLAAPTSSSTTPALAATRPSWRRRTKWQAYWDLHVMAAVEETRARPRAIDEKARRRRHSAQRVDLRRAAAVVRAECSRRVQ